MKIYNSFSKKRILDEFDGYSFKCDPDLKGSDLKYRWLTFSIVVNDTFAMLPTHVYLVKGYTKTWGGVQTPIDEHFIKISEIDSVLQYLHDVDISNLFISFTNDGNLHIKHSNHNGTHEYDFVNAENLTITEMKNYLKNTDYRQNYMRKNKLTYNKANLINALDGYLVDYSYFLSISE